MKIDLDKTKCIRVTDDMRELVNKIWYNLTDVLKLGLGFISEQEKNKNTEIINKINNLDEKIMQLETEKETLKMKYKKPRKLDLSQLKTLIEDSDICRMRKGEECSDCNRCISEDKDLMNIVMF